MNVKTASKETERRNRKHNFLSVDGEAEKCCKSKIIVDANTSREKESFLLCVNDNCTVPDPNYDKCAKDTIRQKSPFKLEAAM